jgi:hypothetical protein
MPWFKFLAAGGVGPFSGYRWPALRASDAPGEWTTADAPLDPCRGGLHLCRQADLPFWVQEELYLVEVEGDVVEHESFVLARRARLTLRVAAWGREMAYGFSCDCAWRVRDHTADTLRRIGRNGDADVLLGCVTMDDLRGAAGRLGNGDGTHVGRLVGYTGDAATYAASGETGSGWAAAAATTAFIAAAAAGFAAGTGPGQAAAVERNEQAVWIAERV